MSGEIPAAVSWHDETLWILDQRLLPHRVVIEPMGSVDDVFRAIRELRVRGAPAIGIAAAYGLAVALQSSTTKSRDQNLASLDAAAESLKSARPTAVNLAWAVDRVSARAHREEENDVYRVVLDEARAIHEEDREICRGIARHGVALIEEGCGIATHCNAGALAVSELGTATAPMYEAHRRGISFRVYADETRPLLQGARLTVWELENAGIDTTLICDGMAAHLMSHGLIDFVLVGTDRVTANGDVVNKIGTLALAIAANHYGVPFYVACPSSTYDPATACGNDVTIEERAADEVREIMGQSITPPGTKVLNPAFDVTPNALVTGIITEHGIARAPLGDSLAGLLARQRVA
jgi:methylthioribose-1-phosphate isomerase